MAGKEKELLGGEVAGKEKELQGGGAFWLMFFLTQRTVRSCSWRFVGLQVDATRCDTFPLERFRTNGEHDISLDPFLKPSPSPSPQESISQTSHPSSMRFFTHSPEYVLSRQER